MAAMYDNFFFFNGNIDLKNAAWFGGHYINMGSPVLVISVILDERVKEEVLLT